MREARSCSTCGAQIPSGAPAGQCVRCLLGFAEDAAEEPNQSRPSSRFGDFELLNDGLEGGMGVVYRARQIRLDRIVALKMIRAGKLASASEIQRFRVEAEAAASLDHPQIVPIYEVGEQEGRHYFTMKWIDGRSLADAMTDSPSAFPDSPARAAALLAKIAQAVHHAHQRGVLHRDLKPANILLDQNGEPHVTDFGLAKRLPSNSKIENRNQELGLTISGAIMGTPGYMSPEQAEGRAKHLTTASDVFSLGAILYHLLTGRAPFEGDTPLEVIQRVVEQEPVRPRAVNSRVAPDLETICRKCLHKEPQRRYVSAGALAEDLQNWLEAKPIAARPVKDWERAWNWVRRHPAVSSLTATVGVSILLGLAGVTWQWRRAEAVNVRLELQQAEDLFSADKSHLALATLARLLRDHPSNRAAAERLINALDQRVFLVPSQGSVPAAAKPSDLSLDGKRRLKLDGVDSFRVVEVLTEQTLLSVPLAHTNPIRSIAFSPDAQRIITASADATAKVWDARSGALLLQLPHRQPVYWAEFSPDGSRIVTATAMWDSAGQLWEATAQLWDATNGLRLGNPMPHLNSINAAHFSPVDGRFVVTASEDYTARVWSGDTGLPVSESARLGSAVEDASFSPDGRQIRLALGSNDIRNFRLTRGFELFAAAKGEAPEVDSRQALEQTLAAFKARLAPKHSGEITSIDLDPTRTVLATASTDKSARLWDARTLQPLADPLVHHTTVNCVRFSPDGLRLVTSTSRPNPRVRLWDVPTAQPLSDWIDSPAPVAAIRFSADGHWIISSAGWKWEIHPESGPLPSWLPALAEGIAGVRYTAGRISEPVPETALLTLQRKVSRLSISEPLVAWANLLWRNDQ